MIDTIRSKHPFRFIPPLPRSRHYNITLPRPESSQRRLKKRVRDQMPLTQLLASLLSVCYVLICYVIQYLTSSCHYASGHVSISIFVYIFRRWIIHLLPFMLICLANVWYYFHITNSSTCLYCGCSLWPCLLEACYPFYGLKITLSWCLLFKHLFKACRGTRVQGQLSWKRLVFALCLNVYIENVYYLLLDQSAFLSLESR